LFRTWDEGGGDEREGREGKRGKGKVREKRRRGFVSR